MPSPGATISTSQVSSTLTPGQRLGTFMVAAITQRGPQYPDPTAPLYSIGDYVNLYGERDATTGAALTYDMLEAYWRSGGGGVHVTRVVGPAATTASLTVADSSSVPTLRIEAAGPGAWANTHVTVGIAAGIAANTFIVQVYLDGALAEVSPDLTSPLDAVTWSALSLHVTIYDLASASSNPRPAPISPAQLTGGADDLASVNDSVWTTTLNTGFPVSMGPGMVAKLGITSASGHQGTVQHAQANNRMAMLDAPRAASQAAMTTLAATVQANAGNAPEYAMLFGPWLSVPPILGGTANRVIPPSAVAAGLVSQQVADTANIAAAGARGQALYVVDVDQVFSDAELDILNGSAVVCPFRRAYSASTIPPVELYGYNTLGKPGNPWRQATSQFLRLQLTDEMSLLAEEFVFSQIDGRGHKIAEFGGAIEGVLMGHYSKDELYGETPSQAFEVDVVTVNTPATVAAGQLNARARVRVSPYAEFVTIEIVKVPVNQSL